MRSKSDLEVCPTKGMGRIGKWNEESPSGVVSGEGKDLGLVLGPHPHKLSRQFVGVWIDHSEVSSCGKGEAGPLKSKVGLRGSPAMSMTFNVIHNFGSSLRQGLLEDGEDYQLFAAYKNIWKWVHKVIHFFRVHRITRQHTNVGGREKKLVFP
jgi:hypothetical protein